VTPSADVVDGVMTSSDTSKNKANIEQLQSKLLRINEQLNVEKKSQDEYVSEYLRLTKSADRSQLNRIKNAFERKNQRSRTHIQQLKRKYEMYESRIRELQSRDVTSQTSRRFRDNIRGISGGVVGGLKQVTHEVLVNRPKGLANKFKSKFGSSDNFENLREDIEEARSGDDVSSNSEYEVKSAIAPSGGGTDHLVVHSSNPIIDERNRTNQHFHQILSEICSLKTGVEDVKENFFKTCEEFKSFQQSVRDDISDVINTLQQERFRCERLESHVNNLVGFQESGLNGLREELNCMQAKFDYHLNERTRQMQEAVGSCQVRISEVERQQQRTGEGRIETNENEIWSNLVGKLMNVVMAILALLLLLATSVVNGVKKIGQSQAATIFIIVLMTSLIITNHHWQFLKSFVTSSN